MCPLLYQSKEILITNHAIRQAKRRRVAYPDQVEQVLRTGRVLRFGKHGIKFIKKSKYGSIVCIGEDVGSCVIIKTIERGN